MTGVKETHCTTCIHRGVCLIKSDFLNAQKEVDNLRVTNSSGGDIRLCDISFIEPVNLRCKFYHRDGPTVRGEV